MAATKILVQRHLFGPDRLGQVTWTMTVHGLEPPSLNGGGGLIRMHHRRYTSLRNGLAYMVRQAKPPRFKSPVFIEYVRSHRAHPLDPIANLPASFKPVEDALVLEGVILDDTPETFSGWEIRQEPRKGRPPFFRVSVRGSLLQ